jgi:hypothetical protein
MLLFSGNSGEPVTGKVDEVPFPIYPEKIDCTRATGLGTGKCQAWLTDQTVKQAGLADVASA